MEKYNYSTDAGIGTVEANSLASALAEIGVDRASIEDGAYGHIECESTGKRWDISEFEGCLYDYQSGDELRDATVREMAESIEAGMSDGGSGVIEVDGRSCYAS